MPATIRVATHPSNAWTAGHTTSSDDLFKGTSPNLYRESKRIIQSSVSSDLFEKNHITPSDNGFVWAAFQAYNQHHHLTIRPDDVWFAILSQLNFYINAHAEELRSHFVSHEGQKELVVEDIGTIDTVDFGRLSRRMTALIQENVKDPNFRDWIMPAFSTTTVCDRTTAAVLMMGSMQAYFSYKMCCACGIPSVTLLGERADYEDILQRLDKLPELGAETSTFADLLRPVLRNFIATFDKEKSDLTRDFWSKIAHRSGGGSGPSYLGGWLTAFCFWDNKGKSMHDYGLRTKQYFGGDPELLVLDGVKYHRVDTSDIPNGFASVPVKVDDNGTAYHTKMLAGAIGIRATSSGDSKLDTIQSLSGWFMFEVDKNSKTEDKPQLW
jgi:hypothetical protein